MKKLLTRLGLLALPFLIYALVVVALDPFCYFNLPSVYSYPYKKRVSLQVYERLWKPLEYKRHPAPSIILGDSRMIRIDPKQVKDVVGEDCYNLSFSGASLPEMIDAFWFAARLQNLRSVYMGIGLNVYNSYFSRNLLDESFRVVDNPIRYITEKKVGESALYLMAHKTRISAEPDMSKDEFWKYTLDVAGRRNFEQYAYPAEWHSRLQEIGRYCKERDIRLTFVIPPSHADMQGQVLRLGRGNDLERFKADLAAIAPVFDFEFPNEFTINRDNFSDPYHMSDQRVIANVIWGGLRPTNVRIVGN